MEKIKRLQDAFAAFLEALVFVKEPKELYDPIAYAVKQQGKRIRPMLCLLACDMYDGPYDEVKYPALALEIAHNFTLIHDDIMDQAPLRRGKDTVFRKWDTNTAILSGDAAVFMAYDAAMHTPKAAACVALLNEAMRAVCEGQRYDLSFETQQEVSVPEYLEMIRLKTAALMASSVQMGAMVAGADEEDQRKLYDFGMDMGMAFQLQDDLLDCYGDVSVVGKIKGGDIVENKRTMMFLKALEFSSPAQRERLTTLYSGVVSLDPQSKTKEVIAMFDELHVKKAVECLIDGYLWQASAHLDDIKLNEERKSHLRRYVDMLFQRV